MDTTQMERERSSRRETPSATWSYPFYHCAAEDEEGEFEFCSSRFDTDEDPLSPTPLSAAGSPYTHHHPALHVDSPENPMLMDLVSSQKARATAGFNPPHRRPPSLQLPHRLHAVMEQQEPICAAAEESHPPLSPYAASHGRGASRSTSNSATSPPKRITPPARRRWTLASLLSRKDHEPNYYSNSSNSSRNSMDGAPQVNSKNAYSMSPGRSPASPYAHHYAAQRAHNENLGKRTSLPYKQNFLGCLGFASVSTAINRAYYSAASPRACGQPISA